MIRVEGRARIKAFRFSKAFGWTIEQVHAIAESVEHLRGKPVQERPDCFLIRTPDAMASETLLANLRPGVEATRA